MFSWVWLPLISKERSICIPNRFTQINKSILILVYLLHSKKKLYASSRVTLESQFGLDIIFDLNKSLFRNEAEHRSWVNITSNFRVKRLRTCKSYGYFVTWCPGRFHVLSQFDISRWCNYGDCIEVQYM